MVKRKSVSLFFCHTTYSLLLLGYKPVQHVNVLNTVDNCNTMVSIIILYYIIIMCGPGSSVGIAIDYLLDGPGIESRWGKIFCLSRPALGSTQPPVQLVPSLSRG